MTSAHGPPATSEPDALHLTVEAFHAARRRIAVHFPPTPLLPLDGLTSPRGNTILIKAESLQPSGSFKIRGAMHVIGGLTAAQRHRGIIAYSTGNHAQAVAMAARKFDASAVIVMSSDAPPAKIEATHRLGATVVMAAPTSKARRTLAETLSRERGLFLIPPFDHPGVITGQGTIALELFDAHAPRPAAIFVPIGGGGLIAGIAAAVKQIDPGVMVIGAEPEWENDAFQSLKSGTRIALGGPSESIADAIKVQTLGELTFPLIQRYVDDIVTVTEAEIATAMALAASTSRLLLEPAGAVALAAALNYQEDVPSGRPFVAIGSGGNVDIARFCALAEPRGTVLTHLHRAVALWP